MGYVVLIALVLIFYRIGEHEYRSGWPLAGASLLLSLTGSHFFGLFGMIGANVALYLVITIYNMTSKRPPGSSSGF